MDFFLWPLKEFSEPKDRLSYWLPWYFLAADGVMVNKDGSLQTTFAFRGPDLASATALELKNLSAQITGAIMRLGTGWCFYSDVVRRVSDTYKTSPADSVMSQAIEAERKTHFLKGIHYENDYYFTLVYLPPPTAQSKILSMMVENNVNENVFEEAINLFKSEATKLFDTLSMYLPETRGLSNEEIISYYHNCVLHFDSIKWQSYLGLILKFGFFAFLVVNWEDIAINQVFESFKTAGMVASGSSATTTPSAVVDTGIYLVSDVIASFSKISGWSAIMGSIGEILLKVVLCLVVIGCFGFMAIQIFLVTVEFYIVTALSVILLPFALTRYTSFLSEKVIGAVFSFGIKMMVLTFILGISIPLIQTWTYVEGKEMSELIKAAIGALTLAFLTVQVPALAQGFLSGSPSLDAGSAISSGRSAASAVSTGGASVMAKSMAGAAMAGSRLQREAGMMSAAAGVSGGSIASGYARTALARGQQSLVNASSRANSLFDTYRNSRSEGSRYV